MTQCAARCRAEDAAGDLGKYSVYRLLLHDLLLRIAQLASTVRSLAWPFLYWEKGVPVSSVPAGEFFNLADGYIPLSRHVFAQCVE